MAFFEIEDSNRNPLNVIIRTRYTLFFVRRTSCCDSSVSFDSESPEIVKYSSRPNSREVRC